MALLNGTPLDTAALAGRRTIGRTLRRTTATVALLDVAVLVGASSLAWALRSSIGMGFEVTSESGVVVQHSVPVLVALWFAVLVLRGAYSTRGFAEGPHDYRVIGVSSFITAAIYGLGLYYLQVPLSRGFLLIAFVLGMPLLIAERYAVRRIIYTLRRRGRYLHKVIAVGNTAAIAEVVDALRRDPCAGYQVVGACVPDELPLDDPLLEVPVLGRVRDTRAQCDQVGADTVLVARGGYATARDLRRIAWDLEGSSIDLVVVPSLTDVAGPRIQMRPVAGLPLLHVEQPQAGRAAGMSKRVFDVVGASVALLWLSPLMVVFALLIWREDRGPVLFRQQRVGRDGQTFDCLKFRSMVVDADEKEAGLRAVAGHVGALWKLERDPRLTSIGALIRRYSIDELPQLLNVVRGEMSLVGPRPQQAWEVATYTDWEGRRLRVRPGMTGLWQVSGRSQLSFNEAIRLDLFYVDNWSMTADLVIMAKTVRAVFGTAGAY